MKRTLSKIALAVLTVGLLGSCAKINERIDGLEGRIDGIENEQIASINSQITNINSSIADLGQIRSDISSLKQSAENHSVDIFNLEEADRALADRILNLEDYLDEVLPKYAEKEWVEATFSTLDQYEATCDTIAKIDARIGVLDAKLSKDIQACADSLTKWVNKTFEGYYTAAQMDAKLTQMKSEIDSAKSSGKISDTKADSLATELTKTKTAVDTAKANIRTEYKAAVKSAIETSEGKLTKALTDAIEEVNGTITALTGRVDALETEVDVLTGRVDKLEKMIQSVTIVPAYSDGSVKVDNDSLYIDCIITPAKVVARLDPADVVILVNKVKTKALAGVDTVKIKSGDLFEKDNTKGTISIRVKILDKLPAAADSTITVAVNVKNGISDYTTDFAPVNCKLLPAGALKGKFTVNAEGKQVHFSKGNLYWDGDSYEFETAQYQSSWNAENHKNLFFWSQNDQISQGQTYNDQDAAVGDVFFTNNTETTPKSDFTVNGVSGKFRSLSAEEWEYILESRTNAENLYTEDVKVCTVEHCLVIAPDNCINGYTFDKTKKKYTQDEWAAAEAAGLICLPPAGYRDDNSVVPAKDADVGSYWTSSSADDVKKAKNLGFKTIN